MVRVAFICEDDAGKKIIETQNFRELLEENNLQLILPVYNAKGKGNLTEDNVKGLVSSALDNGAERIFLLTDMDQDVCVTRTKEQLIIDEACTIVVCKKAIESWFLADTNALSALLKRNEYFDSPEEPSHPFDVINELHKNSHNGRGISKAILAIKMVGEGFSVMAAANHNKCSSARYFADTIRKLGDKKKI